MFNNVKKEEFNWQSIENGVDKGNRYAALVWFFNYLTGNKKVMPYEWLNLILTWNRSNRPPLHPEEVANILDKLWQNYQAHLRPVEYVLQDDEEIQDTLGLEDIPEPETKEERPVPRLMSGAWWLEVNSHCEIRKRIMRRGINYEAVPWPCGSWDCYLCRERMSMDWANYLFKATEGQGLYLVKVKPEDRFQIAQDIRKAQANYIWITGYSESTILLSKPINQARRLYSSHEIRCVFIDATSGMVEFSPINASLSWRLPHSRMLPGAKLVTVTGIPVYRQKEIAVTLGGKICGYSNWQSPEGVNQKEWEREFVAGVRNTEKAIEDKLSKLDKRNRSTAFMELYTLDVHHDMFERYLG